MSNFTNFLAMISTEFHRYLMDNNKIANEIPFDALVIFQVDGEENFNNWHIFYCRGFVFFASPCRDIQCE